MRCGSAAAAGVAAGAVAPAVTVVSAAAAGQSAAERTVVVLAAAAAAAAAKQEQQRRTRVQWSSGRMVPSGSVAAAPVLRVARQMAQLLLLVALAAMTGAVELGLHVWGLGVCCRVCLCWEMGWWWWGPGAEGMMLSVCSTVITNSSWCWRQGKSRGPRSSVQDSQVAFVCPPALYCWSHIQLKG